MKPEARLQKILDHYKLSEPLPKETQQYFLSKNKQYLKKILQASNEYSWLTERALNLIFFAKKIGLRLSFGQAYLVLSLLGLLLLSGFSAGIYYFSLGDARQSEVSSSAISTQPAEVIAADTPLPAHPSQTVKNVTGKLTRNRVRLGVRPFQVIHLDAKFASTYTGLLTKYLVRFLGKELVQPLSNGRKDNLITSTVVGSIERVDNSFLISIRVVDMKSLKVRYLTTETVSSLEHPDKLFASLAKRIADEVH